MKFKNITVEKKEHIGLLKIKRIKEKNSLNIETSYEIFKALAELENDNKIRCIIILGDKKIFSSGADIKELKELGSISAKKKIYSIILTRLKK